MTSEHKTSTMNQKELPPLESIPDSNVCTGRESLPAKMWRLKEAQMRNTVRDALGQEISLLFPYSGDALQLIGLDNNAKTLQLRDAFAQRLLDASQFMSQKAVETLPDFKSCAAANSSQCITDIQKSYTLKLWRRPVLPEELARTNTIISGLPNQTSKVQFMIELLLNSPNFLYRTEIGTEKPVNGKINLSEFEAASLLSYALTDTALDSELLMAAENKQLKISQKIQEQIARLIQK